MFGDGVIRDAGRWIRDKVSPARRRRRRATTPDPLALRVSPDGRVCAGIFRGLEMSPAAGWGGLAARLAGTYEMEIADQVLQLLQRQPTAVLDLGAADGYYAGGIARLCPGITVFGYELDPDVRRVLRWLARRNGLPNLQVRGRITVERLRRGATPGSLVVCDLEGLEDSLIDPVLVPALAASDLIVELHEFAVPGVSERIASRFAATHSIELVDARERGPNDYAHLLDRMAPADAQTAVEEGRPLPRMQWAVMVRR